MRQTSGEEWARRILANELQRDVVHHDDNSKPRMYDLRIGSADHPEYAIECVGAVNSTWTETWNVGPAKNPFFIDVAGNWAVEIKPGANVKRILSELPNLILRLESSGQTQIRFDEDEHDDLENFENLGINFAHCYKERGIGKVYLNMPGIGGAVDHTGSAVSKWLTDFLSDERRADVISKLKHTNAQVNAVVVFVSFASAPWAVDSYLSSEIRAVPSDSPRLDSCIDEVWLVGQFGMSGIRWITQGWQVFRSRGENIDQQPATSFSLE